MISSPIAVIDGDGITVPTYTEVLEYFQEQFRAIYGQDVDLDADTQDGQWMAIIAQACNDANLTTEQTYQAYSPTYAQGAGLSSVVKINGIRRHVASFSSAPVTVVGQAGTDVSNTLVGDSLNLSTTWQLPPNVIIPPSGETTTTAVCTASGAIRADVGTLTRIITPIPGWQTVTNNTAATPGSPVESDADLRRRQTFSVANPSQSIVVGIQGAIASVEGVQRVMVYENPSPTADSNGIPPFSMSAIVQGGDAAKVAEAIALRKTPGSPTYGSTSVLYTDSRGIPSTINFYELILVPITIQISLTALYGFSQAIANQITAQVIDFITTLPIGYDCYLSKLIASTEIPGAAGLTYEVTSVLQYRDNHTPASASDISIAFNEATYTDATLISYTVSGGSSRTQRARVR